MAFPRLALAPALALLVLLLVRPANADPAERVDLHWRAVAPCIDEATLATTVERTVGRPVFHSAAAAAATIDGEIVPLEGGGFRATVSMRSPSGQLLADRELRTPAPSCSALDESVAVVVALMIDGLHEETPISPPSPSPPPPSPPSPLVPPRAVPEPRRAGLAFEAEIGTGAAFGMLPSPSPGAYGAAAIASDRLSLGLAAHAWLPSRKVENGVGAEISAWAATLSACYAPLAEPSLRVSGCLVLGGGSLSAAPIGLASLDTQLPIAVGGVSIDAAASLGGPFWLHLRAAAWSPFVWPDFFFHEADGSQHRVFRPWIVIPSLTLGVGGRFGS